MSVGERMPLDGKPARRNGAAISPWRATGRLVARQLAEWQRCAEMPPDVRPCDLSAKVYRGTVVVTVMGLATGYWRWSFFRRRLVTYDAAHPEWSPEWTRPVAERAWRAR